MKNLTLFYLVFLLVITACSNDDGDEPNITSDDLSGTWVSTGATFNGTADVPFESEVFNVAFTGASTSTDHKLIFSDTSNLFASEGSYDIDWTFSVLGISRTETTNDIEFLGAGTWVRNGNNLTLTVEGEDTAFQITTLTENQLVIKSTTFESLVQDEDFTFENLEAIFVFSKQ